jgi:hypothetical protein
MCFRIEVENICDETIIDCEGNLIEIRHESDPLELGAMNLTWADMPTPTTKINLIRHVKRHLDVLVIYQAGQIRICSQGWPLNRSDFFRRPGAYILSIVISGGKSALEPYRLKLNYTGDWQTSTVEPIGV